MLPSRPADGRPRRAQPGRGRQEVRPVPSRPTHGPEGALDGVGRLGHQACGEVGRALVDDQVCGSSPCRVERGRGLVEHRERSGQVTLEVGDVAAVLHRDRMAEVMPEVAAEPARVREVPIRRGQVAEVQAGVPEQVQRAGLPHVIAVGGETFDRPLHVRRPFGEAALQRDVHPPAAGQCGRPVMPAQHGNGFVEVLEAFTGATRRGERDAQSGLGVGAASLRAGAPSQVAPRPGAHGTQPGDPLVRGARCR